MIKKILLLVLVLSLSLATGCTTVRNEADIYDSPYAGGNQGIVGEFEKMGSVSDTSGANEVWGDEAFLVELILKNKGEYDILAGDITATLQGINMADFGLSTLSSQNQLPIEKVSVYLPEGGEERIDFGEAEYQLVFDGFYDAIFQTEVDYYYETYIAVPQVCFKYNLRDDTLCNIDENKAYYVSGAPIQVNAARERPGGRGIVYLEISVANVGNGRSAAPGEDYKLEYDVVEYQPINPASNPSLWECSSQGNVGVARLTNGRGTIRCRADVPVDALYLQQFSLELNYNYFDTVRENVRIKESLD
ncbi:hypothetical protein GOV05_04415 [Candidatus Woesearchaeota archaeon]|nr:hypothetical protein [Candidatus Woesearchaeota archaeon]